MTGFKLPLPKVSPTFNNRPIFTSTFHYNDTMTMETIAAAPSQDIAPFFASTMAQHLGILVAFGISVAASRYMPAVINGISRLSFIPKVRYNNYFIPPLSALCWVCHYPLLPIGWELALSFRRLCDTLNQPADNNNPRQNLRLQNLSSIFTLSFVQGWIILLSHATIARPLEVQLWNLGSQFLIRFLVSCTGILLVAPKYGRLLVPLVAWGVGTRRIHFGNWYGRGLSTLAMAAVLATPGFHVLFRLGYLLTALAPSLVPISINDWGHAIGALELNLTIVLMVLGVKRMEEKARAGGDGRF